MLQIKTIPKNISTSTSWNFSPLYTKQQLAKDLTNLARKQLDVNTNTLQLLLANNITPTKVFNGRHKETTKNVCLNFNAHRYIKRIVA